MYNNNITEHYHVIPLSFQVFAFVSLACRATLVAAQHHVKILADSRYMSNNGQFGSAYSQADGVDFKEETDAAGNRRGSYSYLDPNGQKRTVSYTAGKDGFRATGDHLPVAPEAAPAAAAPVAPSPPSPWQNQWWVLNFILYYVNNSNPGRNLQVLTLENVPILPVSGATDEQC